MIYRRRTQLRSIFIATKFVIAFPWIKRIFTDMDYCLDFIGVPGLNIGIVDQATYSNYSSRFVQTKKK